MHQRLYFEKSSFIYASPANAPVKTFNEVPRPVWLYALYVTYASYYFSRVTEFLGLDIPENITAAMLQDVSTSDDLSHSRCETD